MTTNNPNVASQRNHSIDIMRCICAFMVVYLHTHYWGGYPMYVCRCAVPVFMMITGYFLYSEDTDKMALKSQKAIKHLLRILLWSVLFYVLLTLYYCYKTHDFTAFSWPVIMKSFTYAELDNLYFGFHLWYLHAVLYALCLLWIALKMKALRLFYVLCPIFLILNLELVKAGLYPIVGNYHMPTYLSFGIPYLVLGMMVRRYKSNIFRLPKMLFPGFCIMLLVLLWVEDKWLVSIGITPNDKYVTTIFLSFALLSMCSRIVCKQENIFALIGRKNSLDIYIFHNFILFLYFSVSSHLPSFFNDVIFLYGSPLIVFIATWLFSMVFRYCLSYIPMFKSKS